MNKLSDLRNSAKYSQKEVAQILGVTQGAISQWELGLCVPNIRFLVTLAEIYKCSVEELIRAIQNLNHPLS